MLFWTIPAKYLYWKHKNIHRIPSILLKWRKTIHHNQIITSLIKTIGLNWRIKKTTGKNCKNNIETEKFTLNRCTYWEILIYCNFLLYYLFFSWFDWIFISYFFTFVYTLHFHILSFFVISCLAGKTEHIALFLLIYRDEILPNLLLNVHIEHMCGSIKLFIRHRLDKRPIFSIIFFLNPEVIYCFFRFEVAWYQRPKIFSVRFIIFDVFLCFNFINKLWYDQGILSNSFISYCNFF